MKSTPNLRGGFWWRLKYVMRLVFTGQAEAMRRREERIRRFHLTGLHGTYVYGRECPDDEVIAIQARKIKGLEQFIANQRKGYLRKVARLERQIETLSQHDTSERQPSPREDK